MYNFFYKILTLENYYNKIDISNIYINLFYFKIIKYKRKDNFFWILIENVKIYIIYIIKKILKKIFKNNIKMNIIINSMEIIKKINPTIIFLTFSII